MGTTKPKTAIVTIGTEIVIGQITNTNSQWLGQKLFALGFDVQKMVSIPDKADLIIKTLNETKDFDLLIFTGGLGPTDDDITKQCLCNFYNSTLEQSQIVLEDIREMILRRDPTAEINRRNQLQALVPTPGKFIRNKVGTAPGLIFDHRIDLPVLIALPGVPFEMKWIWENGAQDFLIQAFNPESQEYTQFFVSGISESALAELLEGWERSLNPEWQLAYLPSPGIIKLRLFNPSENLWLFNQKIEELQQILGKLLIGQGDVTIEELVVKVLTEKQLTLSTAESCTGGKIAHQITSISGASQIFKGGIVAYDNAVKTELLGVSPESLHQFGAVSQQVAEQMAVGILHRMKTDLAIATTGIAGPSGATPDKPIGTVWITIATQHSLFSQKFIFTTLREVDITRASNTALSWLLNVVQNM